MVSLFRLLPLLLVPLDRHTAFFFPSIPFSSFRLLLPPFAHRDRRREEPKRRYSSFHPPLLSSFPPRPVGRDLLDELINRPPRSIYAYVLSRVFAEIESAIAIYCRARKIHDSTGAFADRRELGPPTYGFRHRKRRGGFLVAVPNEI